MTTPPGERALLIPRYVPRPFMTLPIERSLLEALQQCNKRWMHRNALRMYMEIIEQAGAPVEIYYFYARYLVRRGSAEQAHAVLTTALALEPGYQEAHFLMSLVLLMMNDLPGVDHHLRIATAMAPDDWGVWSRWEEYYTARRHRSAAIACLRRAIQLHPSCRRLHQRLDEILASSNKQDVWEPGT